jgi:hypothetical protein
VEELPNKSKMLLQRGLVDVDVGRLHLLELHLELGEPHHERIGLVAVHEVYGNAMKRNCRRSSART